MRVRRLDRNHDYTFGNGQANMAGEEEYVSQKVLTRLQLLRAEWFLDTDAGVPYVSSPDGKVIAGVKPVDLYFASASIKQAILGTQGITEIQKFEIAYDSATRRFRVEATVLNEFGSITKIRTTL